mmetsp:Transcript_6115/g.11024  ORF Transcript_6115/g.11024 Transcript_6115/m.11024 type:complete len:484 (+) Transcript_6115:140-1591(+)
MACLAEMLRRPELLPCCRPHMWIAMLLAGLSLPGASAYEGCKLATLSVRHGNWPVDLEPPFRPLIFDYNVKLDFSMDSFSIDARPVSGCEVASLPTDPTPVRIGRSRAVTLYSRKLETDQKTAYTVTASRLYGSETELQFLTVVGGELSPIFNPAQRMYHVRLDLSFDEARVVYRLRDNEQRIRSSAQEETPSSGVWHQPIEEKPKTGKKKGEVEDDMEASLIAEAEDEAQTEGGGRNAGAGENVGLDAETGAEGSKEGARRLRNSSSGLLAVSTGLLPSRRLGVAVKEPLKTSGEVQFRDAYESFMVDIGFTRTIELTVQCADATQANIGAYKLKVHRPGCSPESPFFDPVKRMCVNFCPSGFYRNRETHRCSKCNTNCKVCTNLLHCEMCVPDTADYNYVVQPDGRCQAIANHLFKKYRWWCIGLATLLGFLVLIGCVGICQLCCSGLCDGSSARGKKVHTYDSDSDEPAPYGARKRLADY